MSKQAALLLIFALLTASSIIFAKTALSSTDMQDDSWSIMADVPNARLGPGVAAVNGKIYVIGGYNEAPLNTNEEYDPATDTWTSKASIPTRRSNFAIAVYQNKIYCIGGGGGIATTEVYDPLTDTWETKASMPTAREFMDANVVDGKIYVIGGSKPINFNNISYVPNINEVYDPETNSWSTSIAPPAIVSNYASAVYDNKIYVFSESSTYIFDPRAGLWSNGIPMPNPGKEAAAGVTTGVLAPKRIYVIGGYPTFSLNQVYDPETDTWTTGASMPTNRYGLGVAVVDDLIYAIGGSGSEAGVANERYAPIEYSPMDSEPEPSQTSSPEPEPVPFPTTFVVAASVATVVVGAGLLVYLKKHKREVV